MRRSLAWAPILILALGGCGVVAVDPAPDDDTPGPEIACSGWSLSKSFTISALDAEMTAGPAFTKVGDGRYALTFVAHTAEPGGRLWHVPIEPWKGAPGIDETLTGGYLGELDSGGGVPFATGRSDVPGRYTLASGRQQFPSVVMFPDIEPGTMTPGARFTIEDLIPDLVWLISRGGHIGYGRSLESGYRQYLRASTSPDDAAATAIACAPTRQRIRAVETDDASAVYALALSARPFGACNDLEPLHESASLLQLSRLDGMTQVPLFETSASSAGNGEIELVLMDDSLWMVWVEGGEQTVRAQRVGFDGTPQTDPIRVTGELVGLSAARLGSQLAVATAQFQGGHQLIVIRIYDADGSLDRTLEIPGYVGAGMALEASADGRSLLLVTTGSDLPPQQMPITIQRFDCE